mmetsp:Transcript_39233/g.62846  ORF Transcript_39233/g.62846 Transcript_39233/m.62846 type:complete len:223 (+) Transcript_39233:135-803(+)|eukprot:jgi/Bigna1/82921/fgenesh1_pg.99_\
MTEFSVKKFQITAEDALLEQDSVVDKEKLAELLEKSGMPENDVKVHIKDFYRVNEKPTIGLFCHEFTRMKNLTSLVNIRKMCLQRKSHRNAPLERGEIQEIFTKSHESEEDAKIQVENLFQALCPAENKLAPLEILKWFSEGFVSSREKMGHKPIAPSFENVKDDSKEEEDKKEEAKKEEAKKEEGKKEVESEGKNKDGTKKEEVEAKEADQQKGEGGKTDT